MDFGGRKEIFRTLVGSHNYGLSTPESDKDYKVFVAPTFDDLYFNKQFSKSYIGETEDLDVHDIRKVSSLWWKANVNFLEVLFSDEIDINRDVFGSGYTKELFYMKDDIARMNLPYLYDACIGMHFNKKKMINKGTEGTQHLVDKYGMDTKQCMHSIRILDFLKRFADNGFTNFKEAIWYEDGEPAKRLLLDIKNGVYFKETYYVIANNMLNAIENKYKGIYKSQKPNEELNNDLIALVQEIVRSNI